MSVQLGSALGHYRIAAALGAGGMGEVYRARDEGLDRDVAIKVLPEAVAEDADRLARFDREAHVLASLNHPNIATLHGFEAEGDTRFLVMELVEGATLAERIAHGPIPVEQGEAAGRGVRAFGKHPTALPPQVDRLAVSRDGDIWIWDLARQTFTRLTFDSGVR